MTVRQVGVALGVATLTAIFTALNGVLSPTGLRMQLPQPF